MLSRRPMLLHEIIITFLLNICNLALELFWRCKHTLSMKQKIYGEKRRQFSIPFVPHSCCCCVLWTKCIYWWSNRTVLISICSILKFLSNVLFFNKTRNTQNISNQTVTFLLHNRMSDSQQQRQQYFLLIVYILSCSSTQQQRQKTENWMNNFCISGNTFNIIIILLLHIFRFACFCQFLTLTV